ncbi:hypothetical protein ACFE04_001435 [Oxalis oulophora]
MKVVAAYLLAVLGGNNSPTAEDIKSILGSVGAEADDERITLLLSETKGKDITELIAAGREKLASVPSGGGGGGVAVAASGGGGGGAAPAAAEAKEEKKEEAKEESDDLSSATCFTVFTGKPLALLTFMFLALLEFVSVPSNVFTVQLFAGYGIQSLRLRNQFLLSASQILFMFRVFRKTGTIITLVKDFGMEIVLPFGYFGIRKKQTSATVVVVVCE